MGKYLSLLLIILASCGIPANYYVEPPISLTGTPGKLNVRANTTNSANYTFTLYGRYYLEGNTREFDEADYDDSNQGSSSFLTSRGYTMIDIDLDPDIYADDLFQNYILTSDTTFSINDNPVRLQIHGAELSLKLNYRNAYSHVIGIYSGANDIDGEGEAFLKKFADYENNGIIPTGLIKMDFAIIAKDLDPGTVTNSESIPVYLGSLDIQIQ